MEDLYRIYLSVATVLTVYGIETSSLERTVLWKTVATVLTVYGIETIKRLYTNYELVLSCNSTYRLRYWNSFLISHKRFYPLLQQYLPFTVLKLAYNRFCSSHQAGSLQQYLPFTVLKLAQNCSVPNASLMRFFRLQQYLPFTVLKLIKNFSCVVLSKCELQQYLPFTVLKPKIYVCGKMEISSLQQYLPFTVLKPEQ